MNQQSFCGSRTGALARAVTRVIQSTNNSTLARSPGATAIIFAMTGTETFGGLIRKGPLAGTQFMSDGTAAPFHDGHVLDLSATTGLQTGTIQGNQVGGSGDQDDRYDMRRAGNERRGS